MTTPPMTSSDPNGLASTPLVTNGNLTYDMEVWTWNPIPWEWWEIVQLVLAIFGIVGNLLVMLVLFRPARRRCTTDTLIAALAVADFLTSIFIIPHPRVATLPETPAGQAYCRIIHSSVLMWISICASIFTLTTISIEMLTAVRYPSVFQRLFTPARTALVIVIIWIISTIINSFSLYVHFVDSGRCFTLFPSNEFQKFIGVSVFVLEYLIPVIVMVSAHAQTICTLRKRTQSASPDRSQRTQDFHQARQRVIYVLIIVVIAFIVCWTPDQFGFLALNIDLIDASHFFSPLYRCFVVLAFVNSCVNPFIYAAMSSGFRKGLRELCGGRQHRHGVHSVFAGVEDSKTSDYTAATDMRTLGQSKI